jgi:SAM-dependent methyltransferase
MGVSQDDDPVLISVAAYSLEPEAYEKRYATHLLDRPARFASLISPKSKILDVGCGPGRDLRIFSEAGHRPTGVDLNPAFVKMAQHHGEVVLGDIREISSLFSSVVFDGIWAQASLVHLRKSEVETLLRDLSVLLKQNGLLYACVPATGESGWHDESDGRRWYTTWPNSSFQSAVNSAGFHIIDVTLGPYVEVWATKP